ncbi:MAG: NAD(+) synthase [Clostridia bacterium]|nr:NAD(+) synthase [Clostridia bacterium]
MHDGFIKVAAVTCTVRVADIDFNTASIISGASEAAKQGARIIVFPELCVTAYTCGDLFLHKPLIEAAERGVCRIAEATANLDALIVIGAPVIYHAGLYNCAVFLKGGKVLALVPKTHLPNYGEFYEMRHFESAPDGLCSVSFCGADVPMGTSLILSCANVTDLVVGCEICEDLWAALPPSTLAARRGATVIVNLSASNASVGKSEYRESLVSMQSARLCCAYIYASAGYGESTTDMVFDAHDIIAEYGKVLASSRFEQHALLADIDVARVADERRRMSDFKTDLSDAQVVSFRFDKLTPTTLTRTFDKMPFVPSDVAHRSERCEEILRIASEGLAKRIEHTHAKSAVIGLSGGLDSTLALLITTRAIDRLSLGRDGIIAVSMPCFGTTERTKNNAETLSNALGVSMREISIERAVKVHLEDIEQSIDDYSVTYENAQARERTQVLMDIANKTGGLVIGTADLSETAMGFSTYNGDHMSMYAVNSSIPKTLVRHLVKYCADKFGGDAAMCMYDILGTPVSPELLPPQDGMIAQKTENIIGPYELHDFFLYCFMRLRYSPRKIYRVALCAWGGTYGKEEIKKWLALFLRRFFAAQFKRSCVPDGPKVGTVALSPRGDWRMPSDAQMSVWEKELEML